VSDIPKLVFRRKKEDLVVNDVKRCTEIEGNDDGGFARVGGEYCLKCEEWMFRWNGGGDMLTATD